MEIWGNIKIEVNDDSPHCCSKACQFFKKFDCTLFPKEDDWSVYIYSKGDGIYALPREVYRKSRCNELFKENHENKNT